MSHYLKIPNELKSPPNDLGDVAKIRRANGNSIWECYVTTREVELDVDETKLTAGWAELVGRNNVQDGDSLLFDYHGNSVFTMWVIGANKVSKELYPSTLQATGHWIMVDGWSLWTTRGDNSMAAASYMVNSDKEGFMANVGPIISGAGYVNVPIAFARRFLIHEGLDEVVPVILRYNDAEVHINMKFYKAGNEVVKCILNSRIADFVRRNNLRDDSVLVFELLSPFDPVQFKLTLFQNVTNP